MLPLGCLETCPSSLDVVFENVLRVFWECFERQTDIHTHTYTHTWIHTYMNTYLHKYIMNTVFRESWWVLCAMIHVSYQAQACFYPLGNGRAACWLHYGPPDGQPHDWGNWSSGWTRCIFCCTRPWLGPLAAHHPAVRHGLENCCKGYHWGLVLRGENNREFTGLLWGGPDLIWFDLMWFDLIWFDLIWACSS